MILKGPSNPNHPGILDPHCPASMGLVEHHSPGFLPAQQPQNAKLKMELGGVKLSSIPSRPGITWIWWEQHRTQIWCGRTFLIRETSLMIP